MARRRNKVTIKQGSTPLHGMETLEQAVHMFLREGKVRNLSEHTLKYYRNELFKCCKLLERQEVDTTPTEISEFTIKEHVILFMLNKGRKETTINATLRALRSLFNFLEAETYILDNPMKNVKLVRQKKTVVETFSRQQLHALFRQADQSTFTGLRDYTMMLLLLETGVRVKELINIKLNDINWTDNVIRVAEPKGHKERQVPFQTTMKRQLSKYVAERGQLEHDTLFVNIDDQPIAVRAVQERIKKYGSMAGIDNVRCSPHTFRHTFAKLSVQNGADVFSLQSCLGHSSMDMVRHYVNMFSNDIYESHKKFSPLEKLL